MTAALVPLQTFESEVNLDVVHVLEEALEHAKKGELAAIAVAWVFADRVTTGSRFSKSECLSAMAGAVGFLHGRIVERAIR